MRNVSSVQCSWFPHNPGGAGLQDGEKLKADLSSALKASSG